MVILTNKLYFVSKCVLINDKKEFLILKRTDYKKDGSQGLWDMPGGSVDEDEDVNEAIKREIKEELQIDLLSSSIFSIQSGPGEPSGYYIFSLFHSKNFNINQKIQLSCEHSEYKWINFEDIKKYQWYSSKKTMNLVKDFLKTL